MSETMLKYQCPSCGGPLEFNPDTQLLTCAYCASQFTQDVVEEANKKKSDNNKVEQNNANTEADEKSESKIDWRTESFEKNHTVTEEQPSYICDSCGAEIISDGNTAATECVFCGNPVVIQSKVKDNLQPDFVIPFKINKAEAELKLKEFYGNKILLPKQFKDANRISKITGMYVPFWLFSCNGKGHAKFKATKSRSWTSGNYRYTNTKHYAVTRAGNMEFKKIPVDASSKMVDEYMDGLEPYNYDELTDFKTLYMAGYFADKFDQSVEECSKRATLRVENSVVQTLRQTVTGYSSVTLTSRNIEMNGEDIHYALLPVWMLNTKYGDKMYQFAINGQTGLVSGELPIDKKKLWLIRLLIFALGTVSLTLLIYLFSIS